MPSMLATASKRLQMVTPSRLLSGFAAQRQVQAAGSSAIGKNVRSRSSLAPPALTGRNLVRSSRAASQELLKLSSTPNVLQRAAHETLRHLLPKAPHINQHRSFVSTSQANSKRRRDYLPAVSGRQAVGAFHAGRRPRFSARNACAGAITSATLGGRPSGSRSQHTEPHRSSGGAGGDNSIPPPLSTTQQKQQQQQQWTLQPASQNQSKEASGMEEKKAAAQPQTASSSTQEAKLAENSQSTSTNMAKSSSSSESKAVESTSSSEETKPKPPLLTRVWTTVKHEAAHYWHGTKLLGKEISISARLVRRLMLGYSLTRRERRQLKRTMADLLRLIPFVPFVLVPFAELLLPVAIKIFPNLLPSTFESKFAAEAKRRGLIKVRLEMAKFLQETIKDGGLQATESLKSKDEFKEFFRKVRSTGEAPSTEDVLRVARLFDDDLTLDNLSRPQLVSVCRYMAINAFGTDNYLRYQIRNRLTKIRKDDMVINSEGIEKLSEHELQKACQDRGIVTLNLTKERLREELKQWIDLHLHEGISGTLLILSKAFNYVAQGSNEGAPLQLKSLELTLSSLPENLLNEAELNVHKDSATNKQRLEVLQEQEELIEDEAEQEQEEKAAREAEKERKSAEKARAAKEEEEAKSLLPKGEVKESSEEPRMTNEQLSELGEALSCLSAQSSVMKEREELKKLMEEVSGLEAGEVQRQLEAETVSKESDAASAAAKDAAASGADAEGQAAEESASEKKKQAKHISNQSAATRSLTKRVSKMLKKIDQQIEAYDKDVGSKMHLIEASSTGKISVDDLEQALRLIKHRPDEEVLEKLVDKLDVDNDGLIPLEHVLELAKAETGLGIMRDAEVKDIREQGKALKNEDRDRPIRKQDIVEG